MPSPGSLFGHVGHVGNLRHARAWVHDSIAPENHIAVR